MYNRYNNIVCEMCVKIPKFHLSASQTSDKFFSVFSIRFILYKFAHIRNNNIQNSNICKDLSVYATTDFILEINVYFM